MTSYCNFVLFKMYTIISLGEVTDRCFVCFESYDESNTTTANILLPCGHGWCCDDCSPRLVNCPICNINFPTIQPIKIFNPRLDQGKLISENIVVL